MSSKPPGKPRFPVLPPPLPLPKPKPPTASGARSGSRPKFQDTETPTGRRHQKVSDFYQLGQLYAEMRPEFQKALMNIAHSMLRLQNEIANLADSVEIEITED